MAAARNGHVDIVKVLVGEKAVAVDTVDISGGTALSYAVEYGHSQVVFYLADMGAMNEPGKEAADEDKKPRRKKSKEKRDSKESADTAEAEDDEDE